MKHQINFQINKDDIDAKLSNEDVPEYEKFNPDGTSSFAKMAKNLQKWDD